LDYLGHAILFGILTILGLMYVKEKRGEYTYKLLLFSIFIIFILSISIEGSQNFIQYRTFNIKDLLSDFIGILIGTYISKPNIVLKR